MLNYAGIPPLAAMAETDCRQLIAAELRSLIARVDLSMRLIDAAMEPEDDSAISDVTLGSIEIVVLDDVSPRYATVGAALNACRAELANALQNLSESDNSA